MSKVLICIDKSKSFRVYLTDSRDLVQEAVDIHKTTPVATAGLGRVLTGTAIMSTMLKEESDKLTVIFTGDGPAKQILATGNGEGEVKGYIANPNVDLPAKNGKLDVGGSLGIGTLTVIRDTGLKEPYTGKIDLVSGEIAEDLTAYHYISEQQNTSIALGVKIDPETLGVAVAGGMFIQMLPGAEEGAIEALEKMIGEMKPITTHLEEVKGGTLEELRDAIFGGMPEEYGLESLEEKEVKWHCGCDKERMRGALMTIGREDLEEIIEEDGEAELGCQFCLNRYKFTKEELADMLDKM